MAAVDSVSAEPVEVELGGKRRKVLFTLASFRYITRKWGSIQAIIGAFQDPAKVAAMAADTLDAIVDFIYAGLLPFDKKITPDEVADWLTPANMKAAIEGATLSFTRSMPEVDPTIPPSTTAGETGTGPT